MLFFVVYLFDRIVHPEALAVTLAGDPGYVFGVYADSFHYHNALCVLYV